MARWLLLDSGPDPWDCDMEKDDRRGWSGKWDF